MKILSKVDSNDENWNGDCDFALIEINKKTAKHLLNLIGKAKELKDSIEQFFRIVVFDYSVHYFSSYDELEEVLDIDGNNATKEVYDSGFAIMPNNFKIDENYEQRTEGDCALIQEDSIGWDCYIKHTNVKITTVRLVKEILESI